MRKVINVITRVISKIEAAGQIAASILLFLMMIVSTVDVFGRYVFSRPLPGAMIFEMMILAGMGWLVVAHTQNHRRHIRVESLVHRLGKPAMSISLIVGDIAMFVYAFLVTWGGWKNATESLAMLETELTESITIPIYHIKFLVPIGAGLLCLQLILDLVNKRWRNVQDDHIK